MPSAGNKNWINAGSHMDKRHCLSSELTALNFFLVNFCFCFSDVGDSHEEFFFSCNYCWPHWVTVFVLFFLLSFSHGMASLWTRTWENPKIKGRARGEEECLTFCEQMFLIFSPAVPFLGFFSVFITWSGTIQWCFWAGLEKSRKTLSFLSKRLWKFCELFETVPPF